MSAAVTFPIRVPSPVPMPLELGRVLAESAVARRAWGTLDDLERTGMIDYVTSAATPHVRERRAALVFMSLSSLSA